MQRSHNVNLCQDCDTPVIGWQHSPVVCNECLYKRDRWEALVQCGVVAIATAVLAFAILSWGLSP